MIGSFVELEQLFSLWLLIVEAQTLHQSGCHVALLPCSLPQIVIFQRYADTGSLHSPRTVKVGREVDTLSGMLAAMTRSTDTGSSRIFVSMAAAGGEGGIAVFNLTCSTSTEAPLPSPTPSPAVSPSPAPSALSTPAPTAPSTVPELVEARLAAAVNGVDVTFEPGPGSSGTTRRRGCVFESTSLLVMRGSRR